MKVPFKCWLQICWLLFTSSTWWLLWTFAVLILEICTWFYFVIKFDVQYGCSFNFVLHLRSSKTNAYTFKTQQMITDISIAYSNSFSQVRCAQHTSLNRCCVYMFNCWVLSCCVSGCCEPGYCVSSCYVCLEFGCHAVVVQAVVCRATVSPSVVCQAVGCQPVVSLCQTVVCL